MIKLGVSPSQPTVDEPYPNCRGFFTKEEAWSYLYRAMGERSYVQPLGTTKRYIATQGPLPTTFNDFWT